MRLQGLVLAAGLSRRMGGFKPLMRIGEASLLSWSVGSLLSGGAECVTVVLGYRAEEARAELERAFAPSQIRFAFNPAFAKSDMLASVKVGVSAMPICDAFYLLPGDMPAVSESTLHALRLAMKGGESTIAFPTIDGYRKHPPLISAACRGKILSYQGEGGLRGVWGSLEGAIARVPVSDEGCLLDADTPEDFERLSRYLLRQRGIVTDKFAQNATL